MATLRAVVISGFTKTDGTTNVKIRLTHHRKTVYFSTDLFIGPDTTLKNGWASGVNADFINMRISDLIAVYQRRYLSIGVNAGKYTSKELKAAMGRDNANTDISFIDFADGYLKKLLSDGRTGSHRGTWPVVTHLKRYRPKLSFQEMDADFLLSFEKYLRKNGVSDGIRSYMTRLRVIFNAGRRQYNDDDRGIIRIPNYPFRRYWITQDRHRSQEKALTVDQVRELIAYDAKTLLKRQGRDVFILMMCLMGINGKDLYNLPPEKGGRIRYTRSKTGHKFNVKVEPEAAALIGRYDLHRYRDEQEMAKNVNKGLREISKAKGWPRVTTNWARHTWATIARNDCKIPKSDVALCLGHKDRDNVITDVYIRYDTRIQDDANRKVMDLIFAEK